MAAQVCPTDVQVHVGQPQIRYQLLRLDGSLRPHLGVHAVLEWHERSLEAAQTVASALQAFLDAHGIGGNSDLTVRNSPPSRTFFLEGKLVA